jgi:transposase InsO family protein
MARSSYYYHSKNLKKPDKYSLIKQKIIEIYDDHKGRYGYRRITFELQNQGYNINHKTVLRLMGNLGLKSIIRRKKQYKSFKGAVGKKAPNILKRDFKANKPNQKWATDITEFRVGNKKLYLSPIIDMFNNEIISYNISNSPNFKQVTEMMYKVIKQLKTDDNPILHSDQGWQYQMKKYQLILKNEGITQSMSRKGNCLDNAVIENFFGILKAELFYTKKFESTNQLKNEIISYIKYYNNKRISSKLNGMSPADYRAQYYKN